MSRSTVWFIWLTTILVALLWISALRQAHGDIFDTAREALNVDVGHADLSGMSLRAGTNLHTGVAASATVFRATGNVGGTCGNFNLVASMRTLFEQVPDMLWGLVQNILRNIPMLLLCEIEPALCDLVKHFQSLINVLLQAQFAQCEQVQTAMAYAGQRLHGGARSQCLEQQANQGVSLPDAMRACSTGLSGLKLPNGRIGPTTNLIEDTLVHYGSSPEIQTLARQLVGDVRLQIGDGSLSINHERPGSGLLGRYQGRRDTYAGALRQAVTEYQTTGTLTDATLRSISLPGQVIPRAAIDALATLQTDGLRYEQHLGQISTALGIGRLTWECHQLQEEISGAMDANSSMMPEQRILIENRLKELERDLRNVIAKTEVSTRLRDATQDLLTEYAKIQHVATEAGFQAPAKVVPKMPFGSQQPAGYSQ